MEAEVYRMLARLAAGMFRRLRRSAISTSYLTSLTSCGEARMERLEAGRLSGKLGQCVCVCVILAGHISA